VLGERMKHVAGHRLVEPVISAGDAAVPGSAAFKRRRGQRLSRTAGSVVLVAAVCSLVVAPTAGADAGATVKAQTQRMSDANLGSHQDGSYNAGDQLTLVCSKRGQAVKGFFSFNIPGGWDDLWYKTSDGHFVADVDIETGTLDVVAPDCGGDAPAPAPPQQPPHGMDAFQRSETVRSAVNFIDTVYVMRDTDCTYYVSSALWDGGMEPTADWTPNTSDSAKIASRLLDPGPSKIAANADMFKNYMVSTGRATISEINWSDNTAGGAQLADVIAYDWNNGADGIVDHVAMVTSFTADGYPQVSQHSPTRLNRGWSWDPEASKWIELSHPGSRAYLIHFI
jgi:hypothetical protein